MYFMDVYNYMGRNVVWLKKIRFVLIEILNKIKEK